MSNNHVTSESPPARNSIWCLRAHWYFPPAQRHFQSAGYVISCYSIWCFRLLHTVRCPRMSVAAHRISENNFVQCDVRQPLRTLKASAPLFRQTRAGNHIFLIGPDLLLAEEEIGRWAGLAVSAGVLDKVLSREATIRYAPPFLIFHFICSVCGGSSSDWGSDK